MLGFPQIKIYFTLPHDRQNSHRHAECTISPEGGRHLLSLLSFDSITFHVIGDPLNVCLLAESRTRRDILTITARHSLLSASYSSPPIACLAVSLPKGRRGWVSTFHIVDPMDDLGAPFTPVVLQFRAGSYETCNLTTRHSHWGAASGLLILIRPALIDDACRHSNTFTISSDPSP